jgi:hypothetical protein
MDSKGNKVELEITEKPVDDPEEGTTQKVFEQKWTGRVTKMDPTTRKQEWSDEVTYPVVID